jgi:thioredoxin-like negative regulator of GroEL
MPRATDPSGALSIREAMQIADRLAADGEVAARTIADLCNRVGRDERALRRILGLLAERRWWNDNVWAAAEIAKEALFDVR